METKDFLRKEEVMAKRTNLKVTLIAALAALIFTSAFAELQFDSDTEKWVEEGFDIRVFSDLPSPIVRCAFGKGGVFGTDLYVLCRFGKVHRVSVDGQVDLIGSVNEDMLGIAFADINSDFGEYIYLGSGDGYWSGNRTIYRMDPIGNVETFFSGVNFVGGTANALNFAPAQGPFSDYLYTHDDNPNRIYQINSSGVSSIFGGDIPLAIDFIFDKWSRFGGDLFVIQSEKSEHGSHADNIWRVRPDGTTTLFLPDAPEVHNGGGDIATPGSAFGGDIYYINNDWAYGSGGRIYRVTPAAERIIFARGFSVHDLSDIVFGPDNLLYVYENSGSQGKIYQIIPLGEISELKIQGPETIGDNSQFQYKAIAVYDDGLTRDITTLMDWSIALNNNCSIIDGMLTVGAIDLPTHVTIKARYSQGDNTKTTEKLVSILPICPSGSALNFDGEDDYVDCGNNEGLDVTEFTWSLWIKRSEVTYGNERALLSNTGPKSDPAEAAGTYALQIDAGGSYQDKIQLVRHGLPVVQCPLSTTPINDMHWHHIAVSRLMNGDVTIYIDGQQDASGYLPESTAFDKIMIGTGHESYSNFKGMMDEVVIFSRALSAEEIQTLMHIRPDMEDPTLVGYWDFDEGNGQVTLDSSIYGNHGTLGSTLEVDDSDPAWVESDAPVGICTLEGIVERNLIDIWNAKVSILEQLYDVMTQEAALLEYMDEKFADRDYGDTSKGDVVKSKQKIHAAVQDELQAGKTIDQSLDKIDDAIKALGIE